MATGVFTTAGDKQVRGVDGAVRPLITIYGLPAAFVPILLDGPLDMDPSFVEAHAAGTSYRPLGTRRRRGVKEARYAHWDYPELVAGYWQAVTEKESCAGFEQRPVGAGSSGGLVDLARQAVVTPVSDSDKGLAAVFCRASLWVSQDVDVLFLDKPRWGESSPLSKARRSGNIVGNNASASQKRRPNDDGTKGDNVEVAQWKGEEIPSLESILQDSIATAEKGSGVIQLLEETAYEQWLELFEALTPKRRRVVKPERTSLEWQIMRALERNLDMAKKAARSHNGTGAVQSYGVSPDDWGDLIQRLRTRAEILAATSPCVAHRKTGQTARGAPFHAERMAYVPRHRPEAEDKPSSLQGSDDNQRALDRVTYLGGVLLPFSVVSGVLSMNEGFEPGQPLFWVFWVATIPLTLFTVLVIYADKLRQVEVWSEVPDPSGSDSESDKGSTKSGGGGKVQETEKGKRKPTPTFGISKYNRPQQPEAVTYSAGGDVVIDLGTPTAETQQPSAEPPGSYGEEQRTDSDRNQDQEENSSDEDTPDEVALPAGGARYHPGWKKKQLGWKGAAMCILKMRKPMWALDEIPFAGREGQGGD